MKIYELAARIDAAIGTSNEGNQEITVHIPGVGTAAIGDVVWHDNCKEYHVVLKTAKTK